MPFRQVKHAVLIEKRRSAYHAKKGIEPGTVLGRVDPPIGRRQPILASVLAATADQLIAAGWGEYARWRIPADWLSRGPRTKFVDEVTSDGRAEAGRKAVGAIL